MLPTFSDPYTTAKGEKRAWVEPHVLKTLWFNTGTQCNLSCKNCYIESSPTNDRLVYIDVDDISPFLDEVKAFHPHIKEIGFTGGEPFLNPHFLSILKKTLERGFSILVLTNAMKPMQKTIEEVRRLGEKFVGKIEFRISVDHYSKEIHEKERGPNTWEPMVAGLAMLFECNITVSIAGRTLISETREEKISGYQKLFDEYGWPLLAETPENLVIFSEMDVDKNVPEITNSCWSILDKNPKDIMCASSRMVVKKKGKIRPEVIACTLLPYEEQFSLGSTIKEAWIPVSLNHPHCATFCVLGGSSCS